MSWQRKNFPESQTLKLEHPPSLLTKVSQGQAISAVGRGWPAKVENIVDLTITQDKIDTLTLLLLYHQVSGILMVQGSRVGLWKYISGILLVEYI